MAFSTILLAGGTGTLGHALTRFLLDTTEATIRILSRGELLQKQMADTFAHHERLRFFLGDVRDQARLNVACAGADLVIHAAALKHIDKGEHDPEEFIKTNVQGTMNVMAACRTMGVQKAVLISTDKACAPVNTYGATKMLAERLWIQGNAYSPQGTVFSAVRYANVAASRGSVLEVWQRCREHQQVLPVTSLHMSRFWLSVHEAVMAAWYTTLHAPRGCLFIPRLPAFDVMDLLLAAHAEAAYIVTGTRPGEKMAEVLMNEEEHARAYQICDDAGKPFGYLIEPLVHSWPYERMQVQDMAVTGLKEPYHSGTWSWRLSVADLRERMAQL